MSNHNNVDLDPDEDYAVKLAATLVRISREQCLADFGDTYLAAARRRTQRLFPMAFAPTLPQVNIPNSPHATLAISMGVTGTNIAGIDRIHSTLTIFPHTPNSIAGIRTTGIFADAPPSYTPFQHHPVGMGFINFGLSNSQSRQTKLGTSNSNPSSVVIGSHFSPREVVSTPDNPPVKGDGYHRNAILPPPPPQRDTTALLLAVLSTGVVGGFIAHQIVNESPPSSLQSIQIPLIKIPQPLSATIHYIPVTTATISPPADRFTHIHAITLRNDGNHANIASAIFGYLHNDYLKFYPQYTYRSNTARQMVHELRTKAPALLTSLGNNAVVNDRFTFAINNEGKVVLTSVQRNGRELLTSEPIVFETPLR